jgi:hypothetical protein
VSSRRQRTRHGIPRLRPPAREGPLRRERSLGHTVDHRDFGVGPIGAEGVDLAEILEVRDRDTERRTSEQCDAHRARARKVSEQDPQGRAMPHGAPCERTGITRAGVPPAWATAPTREQKDTWRGSRRRTRGVSGAADCWNSGMRAAPWQRRTDEPTYDHSTETLPCAKARECAALGEGLRAGPPDRERLARDQPARPTGSSRARSGSGVGSGRAGS